MNLITPKNLRRPRTPIAPQSFWTWFARHESAYRLGQQPPNDFLDAALLQLRPYDPWLKLLVGGGTDGIRELVVTADGDIALFPRVFELVRAAPALPGWRFTALKQGLGMTTVRVEMEGRSFSADTMQFYAEHDPRYPDEIVLVLTHKDYHPPEEDLFQCGGTIYLENALGELDAATRIDRYRVGPPPADTSRLIALHKLPDYLLWREKEGGPRQEGPRPAPRLSEHWRVIEAQDHTGRPLLAAFNRAYHDWPLRPLYPWFIAVHLYYQGGRDGLPDEKQWADLQRQEDALLARLPAHEVLFLGHKTYNHQRLIYLYARDYWQTATLLNAAHEGPFELDFYVHRDRYWRADGLTYESPHPKP